jgi:hypothetical protein
MHSSIAMIKKYKLFLFPFLCLIFFCCNPPVPDETLRYNFLENFNKVEIQPSADKVFKYQSWQKATEGRDAMVIHVFGQASFKLLPEQTGDDLYFGIRLRIPDSARAVCVILVETSSQSDTVFKRLMDAAQNINDQKWSDEYINMAKYKNQVLTVRFSVLYGGTDAWVEWSSPILLEDEK